MTDFDLVLRTIRALQGYLRSKLHVAVFEFDLGALEAIEQSLREATTTLARYSADRPPRNKVSEAEFIAEFNRK